MVFCWFQTSTYFDGDGSSYEMTRLGESSSSSSSINPSYDLGYLGPRLPSFEIPWLAPGSLPWCRAVRPIPGAPRALGAGKRVGCPEPQKKVQHPKKTWGKWGL